MTNLDLVGLLLNLLVFSFYFVICSWSDLRGRCTWTTSRYLYDRRYGWLSAIYHYTSISIDINKRNKPLYAFRQVQPLAAVVGSGFIELSIKCIVVGMLCASLYLLGMPASVDETLMLITLFFTLWLFGVSTGLIFGVAAAFVPEVDKIKSLVTRPLMFISCVFLVYKTFQRSTGTT